MSAAEDHAAMSADLKRAVLTVLYTGDRSLRNRIIPVGDRLIIGRLDDDSVDLTIADRLLSRRHSTISRLGRSTILEITDHDSRNGSFVDGRRVRKKRLNRGDIVRLGVSVFVVEDDQRNRIPEVRIGLRDRLLGHSPAFMAVMERIQKVAGLDDPVIVTGEAGSGKSLVAHELHRKGGRRGPFVSIGCRLGLDDAVRTTERISETNPNGIPRTSPGIPTLTPSNWLGRADGEGVFARAAGGTLVLEEIDLLNPEMQALLLEVMRAKSFTPEGGTPQPLETRIIASSTADLEVAVEAGVFDRELYQQLAGHTLEVPRLKERRADIPLLLNHFFELDEPQRRFRWSATCLEKLLVYDWPSNIRELRAVTRRLAMVEDSITTLRSAHLPKEIRKGVEARNDDSMRASAIMVHSVPSREELRSMLERYNGDVQRIAEYYGKERRNIYRWLVRHDLAAHEYRQR